MPNVQGTVIGVHLQENFKVESITPDGSLMLIFIKCHYYQLRVCNQYWTIHSNSEFVIGKIVCSEDSIVCCMTKSPHPESQLLLCWMADR